MTADERRKLAVEIARELAGLNDEVLNMKGIKDMLGVKSNEAIYARIGAGLPARRKPGIGYYFLKSEVMEFLKRE